MPAAQPPAPATDDRTALDIMTVSPRTCSPFSTITEAALIFRDEACGAVPVLDDGKPVGILTDRDVALALIEYPDLHGRPVSDLMSRDVVTILATDRLDAIEAKFAEVAVRRFLVVDPAGQLVGIVSQSDLPTAQREPASVPATAAIPTQSPRRSAGGRWAWARPGAFWGLLKATASEWSTDKAPRLGAALAFYSVLSLAPLLLIAIAVASLVFGEKAASGQLDDQIQEMVGKEGAEAIQEMLKNAHKPGAGPIAALVGFADVVVRRLGGLRPAPGRHEHDLGGPAQAGPRGPGLPQGPLPLVRDGPGDRLPAADLADFERGGRGGAQPPQRHQPGPQAPAGGGRHRHVRRGRHRSSSP